MMARKSRIEELSVVADPWNLKLKLVRPKGIIYYYKEQLHPQG